MDAPPQPTPAVASPPAPPEPPEVNWREILSFVRTQTRDDRDYFDHLFKRTVWAIGIILAVLAFAVGFVGIRSLTEMRGEMRRVTDSEVTRMRTEVDARIEAEFKTKDIAELVRRVAKERTEQELSRIIITEVSRQVAQGIARQQPNIQRAVLEETKRSVATLGPAIQSVAARETEQQVKKAFGPVQERLASEDELIRVGTLAILARNDDRLSFDKLDALARASTNPDIRAISLSTLNAVVEAHNRSFFETRGFRQKLSNEQLRAYLAAPNPYDRLAAVDTLMASGDRSFVSPLIEVIERDPDLTVVEHAFRAVNALSKNSFTVLDFQSVRRWWQEHKAEFK